MKAITRLRLYKLHAYHIFIDINIVLNIIQHYYTVYLSIRALEKSYLTIMGILGI